MKLVSCSFVILVVTVVVSSVIGVPDHFGVLKAQAEEWKCHKGFKGMSPKQLKAAQKCQEQNIEDEDCFITCYRVGTGTVHAGHYVRGAEVANIASMWDNTHELRGALPWSKLTWDCVKAYEDKGNKWSLDYTGKCGSKDFDKMKECISASRACK